MHGVWDQILDDKFVACYKHGFVMECLDGVWRRFYPRIFTYSADYPEKYVNDLHLLSATKVGNRVLLATVRNKGNWPCPRCLVRKEDIFKLGQVRGIQNRLSRARSYVGDLIKRARDFIYRLGYNVAGAAVERLLLEHSLVPTIVRKPLNVNML